MVTIIARSASIIYSKVFASVRRLPGERTCYVNRIASLCFLFTYFFTDCIFCYRARWKWSRSMGEMAKPRGRRSVRRRPRPLPVSLPSNRDEFAALPTPPSCVSAPPNPRIHRGQRQTWKTYPIWLVENSVFGNVLLLETTKHVLIVRTNSRIILFLVEDLIKDGIVVSTLAIRSVPSLPLNKPNSRVTKCNTIEFDVRILMIRTRHGKERHAPYFSALFHLCHENTI